MRCKFLFVLMCFGLTSVQLQAQQKPTPEEVARDRARNIRLPESDWHYQRVKDYVEETPDDDYLHASEAAYEAFRDIKFSVRIHWGVYAMKHVEASWPLLAMTPAEAAEYNQLYKKWNPTKFDADGWMDFFKRIGAQCMAFTTKHTDGFSLFHTKTRVRSRINYAASTLDADAVTLKPGQYNSAPVWQMKGHPTLEECDLHYSVEESPYKKDIVKQLADAAHKHGIKIDFYFPHVDWYDADFRPYDHNPATRAQPEPSQQTLKEYASHIYNSSTRTPEETRRFLTRHREQLRELLTNYGKIDMLCLDEFLGADVWPELRKTVKMIRQLQPDIMIRNRGIGNYGDYYQPEQWVPPGSNENTGMPWMSICLLGDVFSFDPVAEHYKGAEWIIHNLIDCVAKGGSFMVCIGPDAEGEFHPEAVRQLEEVGDWLRINGRGIYETRFRDVWQSGDYYFTRSKDGKRVFAFTEKVETLHATSLHIPSITPRKNSKVYMFGYKKPLKWTADSDGVTIEIPSELQKNLPSNYAIGFEFESANNEIPVAERVKDLLRQMTLEEKTAQMQDLSLPDFANDTAAIHKKLQGVSFGCITTGAKQSVQEIASGINVLKSYTKHRTRLGIPLLYVAEALHGLSQEGATIFPQAIAMGSTFNPELMQRVGEQIATECKEVGINQLLSPDLDIARELRWGRVEETYGEDPYLVGRMGVAYVSAFNKHNIICTPKHYVAHGTPENGLNLSSVSGGDYELYSVYIKPFADVIRETNPYSLMNAYSSYNGVPVAASKRLMTDILRGELGFKGYVSSDWSSVGMLRSFHAAAKDDADAARQAVLAGIDCEVASDCYSHLDSLVYKGLLTENDIDRCVERILAAKFKAGLFDEPQPPSKSKKGASKQAVVHTDEAVTLALEAARESPVLLKNDDGLLPLQKERLKSIAVIGPNAAVTQFGDYTWTDDGAYGISPLEGIQQIVDKTVKINYAKGCDIWSQDKSGIEEAVRAASESDVAIVFAGTASAWPGLRTPNAVSGESYDLSDLRLPGVQEDLLKAVRATGKPTVLVLVAGKPLAISWAKENIPAIITQWYGGEQQGTAIAEILFGAVNPSGRLNVSFPQSVGHLPVFYNHYKTDRGAFYRQRGTPDKPGLDYVFADPAPLWAFGTGLSYTTFEYKNMRINAEQFNPEQTIVIDVDVTNTGSMDGKEVVQLYVCDKVSSVATPVRELKRFAKVFIPKGESKTVHFELPVSELAIYDCEMKKRVEPGEFELQAGAASDKILLQKTINIQD